MDVTFLYEGVPLASATLECLPRVGERVVLRLHDGLLTREGQPLPYPREVWVQVEKRVFVAYNTAWAEDWIRPYNISSDTHSSHVHLHVVAANTAAEEYIQRLQRAGEET